MNKEALRTLRKTITSPIMAIEISLATMIGGAAYTAIEHNVHKTEQLSLHNASKEERREILVFDKASLTARHKPEVNLRLPKKSWGFYTLFAGGSLLGTGIGWLLTQPARAGRKTNSE